MDPETGHRQIILIPISNQRGRIVFDTPSLVNSVVHLTVYNNCTSCNKACPCVPAPSRSLREKQCNPLTKEYYAPPFFRQYAQQERSKKINGKLLVSALLECSGNISRLRLLFQWHHGHIGIALRQLLFQH